MSPPQMSTDVFCCVIKRYEHNDEIEVCYIRDNKLSDSDGCLDMDLLMDFIQISVNLMDDYIGQIYIKNLDREEINSRYPGAVNHVCNGLCNFPRLCDHIMFFTNSNHN